MGFHGDFTPVLAKHSKNFNLMTGAVTAFTACMRNCRAVAAAAHAHGSRIAVVPAGEQWGDGRLRPAIEDLIGAGAVLARLPGRRSSEAETAVAAFERFQHNLHDALALSTSGKELTGRGFACDVELAAAYAVSGAAPVLREDRFVDASLPVMAC
jgi:2-phosphosulfolactate phosphatase